MNDMEKKLYREIFDREKSSMRDAYLLLGAHSPLELSNRYSIEDQKLMNAHAWDYDNPDLIVNRIKNILEAADSQVLTEDEREWRQEILWFWYHHAISCAIWRHKDKKQAQVYAAKARELQPEDHPNKITQLLNLLVNERLEEAEKWAQTIEVNPEKDTAADLVKEYKEGGFF